MYLLLGYGISNQSISRFMDKEKIKYLIYDDKKINNDINDVNLKDVTCIIKSGSISNEHKLIIQAKDNNIEIISDLEFYYRMQKNKNKQIIACTGTNGKSTMVSLLKSILEDWDLAGNIGYPLGDYIDSDKNIIIEVSSYMSEYITTFTPDIGIFLNIYPNHLDHHHFFIDYLKAKMKLFKNMHFDNILIINKQMEIINSCNELKSEIITIDSLKDYEVLNNNLSVDAIKIACYIGLKYDIPLLKIKEKISNFKGLAHRFEYFYQYKEINFINNSKATNYYNTNYVLNNLIKHQVLLIIGGKRVDNDSYLLETKNIMRLVCYGENRNDLLNVYSKKIKDIYIFENIIEVVNNLPKLLTKIDTILLSPSYQSYDQFKNFEERGNLFKEEVKKVFNALKN